ncbi:helix-turn-helix domain-containing protein [Streptomyces sp. NPDC003027]
MTTTSMTETLRAYRYALDATPAQVEILQRYATAARCGYNFALGYMVAVHQKWACGRDALMATGMDKAVANKAAPKVKVPNAFRAQAFFRETKGQPFVGPLPEGAEQPARYPWWQGVSNRLLHGDGGRGHGVEEQDGLRGQPQGGRPAWSRPWPPPRAPTVYSLRVPLSRKVIILVSLQRWKGDLAGCRLRGRWRSGSIVEALISLLRAAGV